VRLIVALLLASAPAALAVERPSFLQAGDSFCTSEDDFDGMTARGHSRVDSGTETCRTVTKPTRVAILSGQAGLKTMVRIMSGTNAYEIGWTNGTLPVQ
jgi:hypothetical protein